VENLRWIGGVVDPAGFDLDAVNRVLRRARLQGEPRSPLRETGYDRS
jgi:hypothetical protein